MNFSLGLPASIGSGPDSYLTGEVVASIAMAAEAAGFYSVHTADHPFPSESWLQSGGHHSPDPFVALAFAAAATTRIRVMTNLVVLPYRHPAIVAKSIASLDRMSNGRTIVGVGAGYEAEEFEALGVQFSERNEVFDQSFRIINEIWSGTSAAGHSAEPAPLQRPRPPLWVGGNSRIAMRRAVNVADGWMPMANPAALAARRRTSIIETMAELDSRVAEMRRYADCIRRESYPKVSFTPFTPFPARFSATFEISRWLKEVDAFRRIGVEHLRLEIERNSKAEYLDAVGDLGAVVCSRFGGSEAL